MPMEIKIRTLPDLFEQSAPSDTRKTLYFDLTGQEITFAVFYNRVELATELLKKLGVKKGQTVAILSDNLANWACAYFAIARVGAIALPLLPEMNDHDITLFLNAHEVRLVFTSAAYTQRLSRLDVKSLTVLVSLEDFSLKHLAADREKVHERLGRELERFKKAALEFIRGAVEEDVPTIQADDPFCVLYVPDEKNRWRPVHLSQQNIVSAAVAVARALKLNETHRLALFLPLSLTLPALLGILVPLLVNAQSIFLKRTEDACTLQDQLKQFQPTHLFVDTAMAQAVFKSTRPKPAFKTSLIRRSLKALSTWFGRVAGKSETRKCAFPEGYHWLICTNFAPLGIQLKRYLQEQKIAHHLLFGSFNSASVFLTGKADNDFCWVRGQILPALEWRIEAPAESDVATLWLKGPMLSLSDAVQRSEDGFMNTEWVADEKERTVRILGPLGHQLKSASGKAVAPELIEAILNEYDWVAESWVYLEGEALFVRLYPDPQKVGDAARKYPERLALELLQKIRTSLPESVQIKGISIESEPFKRNVFGQILRSS